MSSEIIPNSINSFISAQLTQILGLLITTGKPANWRPELDEENGNANIGSARFPVLKWRPVFLLNRSIVAVPARGTKSLKFTLSIAVHRGGLAKNHFWPVATQKKRIGKQLNQFLNMCPEPFSWAKNKRKLLSDGKSRGTLLARAALKSGKEVLT